MTSTITAAAAGVAALAALAALPAHAAEPFRTYDNFAGPQLDLAKWQETERVRQIRRGALNLLQRTLPATTGDTGITSVNWNENLANPAAINAIKAKVTVHAVETSSCSANPAAGQSRARIVGGFFNSGTPTPGSQVGDVIAQVRITRLSNSTDPAGVLRVQGIASRCLDSSCQQTTTLGSVVELGTVALGSATTVQLQWDQPAKTFLFARDGSATGAVTYTDSDSAPPGVAFKQVSTRVDLPNCASAAGSAALVDADFDNVQVNRSALP